MIPRLFPFVGPINSLLLKAAALILGCWCAGVCALTHDEIAMIPALKVGDVILRQGTQADSYFICKASGSRYSHSGMVASTKDGKVIIVHATTDDDEKRKNRVIESTLEDFASRASVLAVKRYPLTQKQQDAIADYLFSMLGRPFELTGDKDDLYCTTLLTRALEHCFDMSLLPYDKVELPAVGGLYLFPQRFWEDERSTLIFEYPAAEP